MLLPMIISIFIYNISNNTLKNEIHQANNALLSQVRETMDNYFDSMKRLTYELIWNVKVGELLFSNKYTASIPEEYYYDSYQITKDLKQYQSAYSVVDMSYIYLQKDNTVLYPETIRYGLDGFQLIHGTSNAYTYQQWIELMSQPQFKGFVPMVRIDRNNKLQKTVAYINSYNSILNDNGPPPATSVTMIDQSRILGVIENVELFNNGHVIILNDQNHVLVSNAEDSLMDQLPKDFIQGTSGMSYYTIGQESYEILYQKSAKSGLTYVSFIPTSLYWQKAELIRTLTITSTIISLLAGLLLAVFFLRRNYTPVRRLVQAFSVTGEHGIGKDSNEFQFIQQAVDDTLHKMDSIVIQMEQQRHILRSNFIGRLLKGRIDSQIPIDESLATFHMNFHSDDFAVILVYLESTEPFYEAISGTDDSYKRKLLQFIITNVIEELANQQHVGYVAEIDEALACLINFRAFNKESRLGELRRIAEEAQRFLTSHYRVRLTVSISGLHRTTAGISQAYQQALDAMEYKLVMGSKDVLSYDEIAELTSEKNEVSYSYPLQVEQQLINSLKIGDYEKSKNLLDSIIADNFNGASVSVAYARCLMLNLVSTIIKAVSEIGSVQDSFLVQNPKRIEQLTACRTIEDMQEKMTEFVKTVCEYTSLRRQQNLQASRDQEVNHLVAQVIDFIHDNYTDSNLNISMLGQHFGMKPTYLSKMFKDQTGEGLLDYINKRRVEKAKQLIGERSLQVSEVTGCVGFNDVNVFIRTFKKYEGITPGKFKDLQEEK